MDSLIAFNTETHIHLRISTISSRSIIVLGETPRIMSLTENLQLCFIGSNALSHRLSALFKVQIEFLDRKREIFGKSMTLKEAANLIRHIVYLNIRKIRIDCQFVIFDKRKSNDLYVIDMYGCMSKSNYVALGLASYFCFGLFDNKFDTKLNKEEGIQLIKQCAKAVNNSVVDMRDKNYIIDKSTGIIEEYE